MVGYLLFALQFIKTLRLWCENSTYVEGVLVSTINSVFYFSTKRVLNINGFSHASFLA